MGIKQIRSDLELTLQKFDPTDARFPAGDQLFYWWTQLRASRLTNIVMLNNRLIDVVQTLPQYIQYQTRLFRRNANPIGQERYVVDAENISEFSLEYTCHLLILLTEYTYICWMQKFRSEFKLDHTQYLLVAGQLANAIWDLRINHGFVPKLDDNLQPIEPIEPFQQCGLAYYALFNWYALCREIGNPAVGDNIFGAFALLSSKHLTLLDNAEKCAQCDQHWLAVSIASRALIGVSENLPWVNAASAMLQREEINWSDLTTPLPLAQQCLARLALSRYAIEQIAERQRNRKSLNKLLSMTTDGMIINKMSIDVAATCYMIHAMSAYIRQYCGGTA